MKTCPTCKEEVRDDALKCRYCHSAFEGPDAPTASAQPALAVPQSAASASDGEKSGNVVLILDQGLVYFAKFAAGVVGLFVLLGTYLFGIKLESTAEKMRAAQEALHTTQKDFDALKETAKEIAAQVTTARADVKMAQEQIKNYRDFAAENATAIGKDREDLRKASQEFLADMKKARALSSEQQTALSEAKRTTPEKFRSADPSGHTKLWPVASTVRVRFLDGDANHIEKFKSAVNEWLKYANLRIEYVAKEPSEVRASFANQFESWSYVGTDALANANNQGATIMVGYDPDGASVPPSYLHELGHVLGLVHETSNPNAKSLLNLDQIYAVLSRPPTNWTRAEVDAQLFPHEAYPGARPFDRSSIMLYAMPGEFFTDGVGVLAPTGLSESDKKYVASLYPGK